MLDLDAYLERLGVDRGAAMREVHRSHVTAIPFENLDPRRGIPVSLESEDLERKLVAQRRGGYCFEQNMLLGGALEAMGFEVDPMLARVRTGAPPGTVRPRSHLVLRVRAGGESWLADVGFGMGTLLEPIPFGPGGTYEQAGWEFRVVQDGRELVLQTRESSAWRDVYGFVPEPVPRVDVEVSNWYTSTHPRSPFVTGLIVATQSADGVRVALNDWSELSLTEQSPASTSVSPVEPEAVPELLERRFGLPRTALDGDARVIQRA